MRSSALASSEPLLARVSEWMSSDDPAHAFPQQHITVTPEEAIAQLLAVGPIAPLRQLLDVQEVQRPAFRSNEAEASSKVDLLVDGFRQACGPGEKREATSQLVRFALGEINYLPSMERRVYQRHLRGDAAKELSKHAKETLAVASLSDSPVVDGDGGSHTCSMEVVDCADMLLSLGQDFHERHNMWNQRGITIFPLIVDMLESRSDPVACKGLILAHQLLHANHQRYGLRFQDEDSSRSKQGGSPLARLILEAMLRLLQPACQPPMAGGDEHETRAQACEYLDSLWVLCTVRIHQGGHAGSGFRKFPRALWLLLRGSPYHCRMLSVEDAQRLISTASHLAGSLEHYLLASEILEILSQLLSFGHTDVSGFIASDKDLIGVAALCLRHLCSPDVKGSPDLAYDLLGKLVLAKRSAEPATDSLDGEDQTISGPSAMPEAEHAPPMGGNMTGQAIAQVR